MAGRVVKVKRILTPSLPKFRALHPLKSSASPAGIAYVLVVGALFSYWLILIAFVLYLDFFFFLKPRVGKLPSMLSTFKLSFIFKNLTS